MAQSSNTLVVDSDWSRGMIRDAPRGQIPEGGLFNARDFLLHRPGMAQKRGGTTYSGSPLGSSNHLVAVAYAEYPDHGATLVGIDVNANGWRVSGSPDDLGAAYATIDNPKFRVGGGKNLLIVCAADGTSSPKTYDGDGASDFIALGGSPPAGKFACIYKTRLVLAGTAANPSRLYFSDVPDITSTWDTTESWVDSDFPVTGLAALQNAILIWSQRKLQRITGSTPPPGTDFDRAPIADVGCFDARSIVVYRGRALFANEDGVWATSGSGDPDNLTTLGGIETYWQSLLDGFDPSSWIVASGVLRGHLIVCVTHSGTLIDCLMCNLSRNAWWRLKNIRAAMFAASVGVTSELYYADLATNNVVAMSGIFSPGSSNKNDADGTPIEPVLETRLLAAGPTRKHYGFSHVSMDMRDAASDNPSMEVKVAPGLEATTFSTVSESPLYEKTDSNRYRFTVAKVSQGVSVRFTQSNASQKTEVYALEADVRALPVTAGGQ